MNERIRELALQAGYKPLSPPTFADELNEIFMQKFAELMVRECADISDASFHNGSAGYLAILKNFGVEQ